MGVDYSSNMIEQARADYKDDSHMLFEVADASKDLETMKHRFDLVFSNACIQWVPNHDKLINDIINAVKSGGYLAIQQPYNYD
ncbi:MAG TPA: methyltransferase domain-containing protein, partial [Saccharofermentans sp.]|nr:methyltransferase domain-containing protein [Saccharofermentans sp.]